MTKQRKEDFTDVITARDSYEKAYAELVDYQASHWLPLHLPESPEQTKAMRRRNALWKRVRKAFDELEAALRRHRLLEDAVLSTGRFS